MRRWTHAIALRSTFSSTATQGTIHPAPSTRAGTAGAPLQRPTSSRLQRARSVGTTLLHYRTAVGHQPIGYVDTFGHGGDAAIGVTARCAVYRPSCSIWTSRLPIGARDPTHWSCFTVSRKPHGHMSVRRANTSKIVSSAIFSGACRRRLTHFLHGQASHRQQSILRVRSQIETIRHRGLPEGAQLRGQSPTDLESLFPVETSPHDVVNRILESEPVADLEKWRGSILGLVNPRESPRKAHVDPDRSLLGSLQDHLNAHSFSYGEIAHLTPDGEGGTQQQQRDRVKNRLQHRRRER